MKIIQKLTSVMLSLLFVVSLVACSSGAKTESTDTAETTSEASMMEEPAMEEDSTMIEVDSLSAEAADSTATM